MLQKGILSLSLLILFPILPVFPLPTRHLPFSPKYACFTSPMFCVYCLVLLAAKHHSLMKFPPHVSACFLHLSSECQTFRLVRRRERKRLTKQEARSNCECLILAGTHNLQEMREEGGEREREREEWKREEWVRDEDSSSSFMKST